MRKLILILWAGILSVFSISCYDDEGSNDYHSINEVKFPIGKKEVIRLFLRVIL